MNLKEAISYVIRKILRFKTPEEIINEDRELFDRLAKE